MLKRGDRTSETLVMRVEEWSPVNFKNNMLFNRNSDCEYDEKGRSKKGVMPYAKEETIKATLC